MTTSQIAVGIFDSCFDRFIGSDHMMVVLISLFQALGNLMPSATLGSSMVTFLQNAERRAASFDMLLVLIWVVAPTVRKGSRARLVLNMAASKVESIPDPWPHNSMQFIDKENHVTVFFDVLDDTVHPFFEVPTEARPSNDIHEI